MDRDVGRAPLKVTHRIATLRHQLAHEAIGFRHDSRWVIDEVALEQGPFLSEACCLGLGQRNEFQSFDAGLAGFELGFGLFAITDGFHDATVFRAEAFLRRAPRAAPFLSHVRCRRAGQKERLLEPGVYFA
jgi:hypothetical protein